MVTRQQDFSFLAALFSVFLCALFGANPVAIKLSYTGLGVFTTVVLRFSIAALTIFIWAKATRQSFKLKRNQVSQLVVFSAIFTLQLSCFYFGLSKTNASRGALLANLLPFFILFLSHFFIPEDPITRRKFLGILLGFAGVAFIFMEKKGVAEGFRLGDSVILLAVILWASNTVYLKRIINEFSPFMIVLFSMLFALPFYLVAALLWDSPMVSELNSQIIGAVLYQGFVTASFGFVAWNTMLQRYGAVALHSFVFIIPITGVMLGGFVLNEPITLKILLALILIVSGILVVHMKPKKEAPVYPIRRNI